MNAIEQARQAYAPTSAVIRTPRSTELQLFSQITARLRRAEKSGNRRDLIAALHDNRKLWTMIAIDVADVDNALPQALRAQIFYLAEFTGQHTGKVLRHEAEVSSLIDINNAIIAGLAAAGGSQ